MTTPTTTPTPRLTHGHTVRGLPIDDQTRCTHWQSELDIIALRIHCCRDWYPCYDCHAETTDHPATVWPLDQRDTEAILCGACGHTLTINQYLACESTCPACAAPFNPGCATHAHLYFQVD